MNLREIWWKLFQELNNGLGNRGFKDTKYLLRQSEYLLIPNSPLHKCTRDESPGRIPKTNPECLKNHEIISDLIQTELHILRAKFELISLFFILIWIFFSECISYAIGPRLDSSSFFFKWFKRKRDGKRKRYDTKSKYRFISLCLLAKELRSRHTGLPILPFAMHQGILRIMWLVT